jgi:AraC-like DNA-binding protein
LKIYSLSGRAPNARLPYWNDLLCSFFSPLEVSPLVKESFDARVSVDSVGPLIITKTFSSAATLEHTDYHVKRTSERKVFVLMPLEGPVSSQHYGYEGELLEGDIMLSDSFAPSRLAFAGPNHSLGIAMPYPLLTQYLPNPEPFFGRPIRCNAGLGHMISTMLRTLWDQVERGLPSEFGGNVAKSCLDLLATACAMAYPTDVAQSSVAAARRAQVKRYVERHLRDNGLTASAVAQGLGLSTRYIRMVFESESESISDYILRRRLEECARQLTQALWQRRSITDTAFEWGFSSMAHFTRAFKERFAVTPSEYRRTRIS